MTIAFRSHAVASSGASTTSTTVAVSKPTGTVSGDLLVALISQSSGTTTITAPAGWTHRGTVQFNGSFTGVASVYTKAAGASEGASYTWTLGSAQAWTAFIAAYSGSNPAVDQFASNVSGATSSTSVVAPTITPIQAPSVMLAIAAPKANPGSFTPPIGMTERIDYASTAGNPIVSLADLTLADAASTGTKTFTHSGNASNWGAFSLNIYEQFTAATAKHWDGAAWTAKPLKRWDGSAWVEVEASKFKFWNGTAWTEV